MRKSKRIFAFAFVLLSALSCQEEESPVADQQPGVESQDAAPERLSGDNARYAGHVYWYFYRGESTTNLRYAYSDNGTTWSGNGTFDNNAKSNTGPAVTFLNGKFIAVCRGASSTQLYTFSSTNGINWSQVISIPGAHTSAAPALVTMGGKAVAYFTGNSSGQIWQTSSSDGVTWTTPSQILTPPPSPVVSAGALGAVVEPWAGEPSGPERVTIFYWQPDNVIAFISSTSPSTFPSAPQYVVDCSNQTPAKTDAGIAVTSGIGGINIAFKGLTSHQVYYGRPTCSANGFTLTTIGGQTSNRPGIAYVGNKLTIVYKGQSANSIFYSQSFDGITWTGNVPAIGQTYGGGPWLMGQP